VWVPGLLRALTGGQEQLEMSGQTVGQLIDALDAAYPGVRERLCTGDRLNPAVTVWIDGRSGQLGLLEPVREGSEVQFLPAVGGG
jgi:molybdopterin converting factor small subunit